MTLTDQEVETLRLISRLNVSTELRYIQTGYKVHPVYGPLQELSEKLVDAICPVIWLAHEKKPKQTGT